MFVYLLHAMKMDLVIPYYVCDDWMHKKCSGMISLCLPCEYLTMYSIVHVWCDQLNI